MKTFVKKLVSLNPDRYENIEFDQALKDYAEWCFFLGHNGNSINELKTFISWLDSEI